MKLPENCPTCNLTWIESTPVLKTYACGTRIILREGKIEIDKQVCQKKSKKEVMPDIKKVEKWVTRDGKEHHFEATAVLWDEELDKAEEATRLFKTGMQLAIVYKKIYGRDCPENLKMVTKETLFTISYLQCCDYPHYTITHFKPVGFVYVHGAQKGYQNPYGATMNLDQLSQHYERTVA